MLDNIKTITNGTLTIIYNEDELFNAYPQTNVYAYYSFQTLSDKFSAPDVKDAECNVDNTTALKHVDAMKKALQAFLSSEQTAKIFDYIELTKAKKFHKTKQFTLIRSGIIFAEIGDGYVSRREICVRLVPVTEPDLTLDDLMSPIKTANPDLIREMVISYAPVNKDTPASIINPDGSLNTAPAPVKTKIEYIKKKDLVPGTAYIDKTGKTWLYCGILDLKAVDAKFNNRFNSDKWPVYVRLDKEYAVPNGMTSLEDFIERLIKRNIAYNYISIYKGRIYIHSNDNGPKPSNSRKFVKVDRKYFDNVRIDTRIHDFGNGIKFIFTN